MFLANDALTAMKWKHVSQSFLITGVSGSGKTETSKHVIEFLSGVSDLETITNSGLILEVFGNARTHLNSNSSRFCKFIEVHLSNRGNFKS